MYEPKRPTLVATGLFSLWVALLSLPMLQGKWLASPWGDQYAAGYAFRHWGAEWWHRLGHVPLWNPELFGGLPFVAAGHGDIFYPTSFLRLVLPVATVVNLAFVLHYILAGLFTYWLLRRLQVSWTGSVIGGVAYELSGLIASYPSPGHDGKLFASAALPLACLALVMALRDRRWEGYPLLAIAVALSLLGHFQIAYYLLIAAGLFALYLTVEASSDAPARRLGRLGLALGAVLLGFGLTAIQLLPFIQYIPFSPRAQGYHGFEGSTSYAIPWSHVLEFFLKNFVGDTGTGTYWGSNPLKLHSEYLGLPVLALAALGIGTRDRRRLALWIGGIGLLFLLVSLGAATPFYKLWWALMPMVKKTRAPGMAFFVVAFVTALFAGLGAERLERKEGGRAPTPWLVVAGVVALLAVTGVFGAMAQSLAAAVEAATGFQKVAAARANAPTIMWGALGSGLALGATALVALALLRDRLTPRLFSLTLPAILGCDLWLNAQHFWGYAPRPEADLFRPDAVTDRLKATPLPYRVLDLGVYPGHGVSLMAFDVPQVLGYHGNELRYYDELLGREGDFWSNLRFVRLWDLLAVRYAVVPAGARNADSIPGYKRVLDSVPTSAGTAAHLLERTEPQPYARVVAGAFKATDSGVVVPTLVDPRIDYGRVVLFTPDQPVAPAPIREMPPPSPSRAAVTTWEPGRMTVALDPAPPQPSYLVVAENWYPDWHATVDGTPQPVLRGDYALITVDVPAGAKRVDLAFRSAAYASGRTISLVCLGVLVFVTVVPLLLGRKRDA